MTLGICSLQGQKALSLEDCLRMAVDNSLIIAQGDLGIRNAEISLDLAKQARNPNLNGNSSVYWNFGRTIDPTSNEFITERFFSNNYGLSTGMNLFNGFRVKKTIEKSEIDLQASQADNRQAELNIALQTALNYLNVLFTKENLTIARQQRTVNETQLTRVNKSIAAGALPESERLNLESQLAQSDQAIVVAENSYELALFQLKQNMRMNPDEEIDIIVPESIDLQTDPDLLTFQELLSQAEKNRYDLKAASLRNESAHLDVDIAKSGYYPSLRLIGNLGTNFSNQARDIVGVQNITIQNELVINGVPVTVESEQQVPILEDASYTSQLNNFLSYGFGLGLNIPIYNNGLVKGQVQRAELGIINQQLSRDQIYESFALSMQQALADARAAKRRLSASEKALQAQKAVFDNLTKRYELGASNSFEWETQRSQVEQAEVNRLIDRYDYLFKVKVLDFYLGKSLNL